MYIFFIERNNILSFHSTCTVYGLDYTNKYFPALLTLSIQHLKHRVQLPKASLTKVTP